jgi:hypothetical protein
MRGQWVALAAVFLALKAEDQKMGEPKPLASLSGLLLARKGAARPAMRRPTTDGSVGNLSVLHEDLGWNDMGYDVDPDQSVPMDHEHDSGRNPLANAVPEANSYVREQQQQIARQLEAQAEVGFESIAPLPVFVAPEPVRLAVAASQTAEPRFTQAPPRASVVEVSEPVSIEQFKKRAVAGTKAKAAFTLRLNAERHLKLRLACAVNNKSAQMLVTEALDVLLDNMPEIAQLAARLPANK